LEFEIWNLKFENQKCEPVAEVIGAGVAFE